MDGFEISKKGSLYKLQRGNETLYIDEKHHITNLSDFNDLFRVNVEGNPTLEQLASMDIGYPAANDFIKRVLNGIEDLERKRGEDRFTNEKIDELKKRRSDLGQLTLLAFSVLFLMIVITVIRITDHSDIEIDNPNSLKNNMFWS